MKIAVVGVFRERGRKRLGALMSEALDRLGCTHLVTPHNGVLAQCAKRWLRDRPDVQHTEIVTYRGWAGVRAPAETIAWELLHQHKPDLVLGLCLERYWLKVARWLQPHGVRIAACTRGGVWSAPELHPVENGVPS